MELKQQIVAKCMGMQTATRLNFIITAFVKVRTVIMKCPLQMRKPRSGEVCQVSD